MKKFDEVEQAKALMTEGLSWSVMKWIAEKKRVRKAADKANNLLWTTQKTLKRILERRADCGLRRTGWG